MPAPPRRRSRAQSGADAAQVCAALDAVASEEKAASSRWFFKTGRGQYGEGDRFIGVTVPEQRRVAKRHADLSLAEIAKLLRSGIHEHRLTGFLILIERYRRGGAGDRQRAFRFFMRHRRRANNWDLVDTVAPNVAGAYLAEHPHERSVLYELARSKNLWERRIAILTTYAFIKEGEFDDALRLAEMLLGDEHDLMHKAVGWMLREVGNRAPRVEREFLDRHAPAMPKTMLRYAIEKFSQAERQRYRELGRSSGKRTGIG